MIKINKLRRHIDENDHEGKFLNDTDVVLDYINKIEKLETRKSYLSSVTTTCNVLGVPCVEYCNCLSDTIQMIKKKNINEKTEKQSENWANISELKSVIAYYETLMSKTKDKSIINRLMRNWIVACLYVLDEANPPVRLDYSVVIVDKKDYSEKIVDNFLVMNNGEPEFFSFSDYKSVKKYGVTKIRVGKKLKNALKLWLKHSGNTEFLLVDGRHKRMTKSALGQLIPRVFSPLGRHITLNMLRHVFITDKLQYDDMELTKQRRITARRMMHSVRTQEDYVRVES
jgi:hypothetical protein